MQSVQGRPLGGGEIEAALNDIKPRSMLMSGECAFQARQELCGQCH